MLALLGLLALDAAVSVVWLPHLAVPWWTVAAAFFVVEATALHVEIQRETHTLSLSGIPLMIGLLALSPPALVVARLVGNGVALVAVRRQRGLKLVWNLALYTLETAAAALVASFPLSQGRPASLAAWVLLLVAVLMAELVGLIAVPMVIMLAEGELRLSRYAQVGRSELLALLSATFGTVTAAAMLDLPSLVVFALIPLIGVALLLRTFGRLGKEHHDLQQLHSFTNAIAGPNSLDAGLAQLQVILRATQAVLAVTADDGTFALRVKAEHAGLVDRTIELGPGLARPDGPVDIVDPDAKPSEATALVEALGGGRGLVVPIADHAGSRGYLIVVDRMGATDVFGADEVRLFTSLAAALDARLSADRLLQQLETQARTDGLTGLANRSTVEAELEARIGRGDSTGAVLLLDLDRFKDVNDSLGHQFGDELLRVMADRLRRSTRVGDVAGRLGGDEFALVLEFDPAYPDPSAALEAQLDSLVGRLTESAEIDGLGLEIGVSVGAAQWPADADDPTELLRLADIAMYEAKRTQQRWVRYHPAIDHASADRLALLGEVREAIADRQLRIHLQPQVRTDDLALVGAEALLRWHHPTRGMIPPGEFLPLAEQSSLAEPLTRHVVAEAASAARDLQAMGLDLTLWVNLTARDLLDPALASHVASSAVAAGVDSTRLGFEVTEGSLIINLDCAIANLEALRRLGCSTSVDDFGTGYASLRYLQRLPVDEIKIDRSFVAEATTSGGTEAIVRSTTRLVQDLGRRVVAEGVEDQATVDLLRQIGCDVIQGYHVSRPLELEAFVAWARQWDPVPSAGPAGRP